MLKNKFVLILSALVLVGGVIFFLTKKSGAKPPQNANTTQTITMSDVAKHADASSCWMVIEGKVYDVTSFIPSHPGGDAILQGCGKDATAMFNSRPQDGSSHSSRARNMLSGLQIGVVAN